MLASGIQVINGGKIQGDLYEGPKNHKKRALLMRQALGV